MRKRFLTLEDAVKVAVNHFDADPEIAEIEFEQKCYMSNEMRIDMDKAREKFMDGRYSTKAWQNFYEMVSACAISEENENNTPQVKGKGLILFTQYIHCVDEKTHPFQREPLVLRAGDIVLLKERHENKEYYNSLKGKFDKFDATVTVVGTQYGDYTVAEKLEDVLRVWAEAL